MSNKLDLYSSDSQDDTTYYASAGDDQIRYFQIGVKDIWELETLSEPMRGTSYVTFNESYGGDYNDVGYAITESDDGGYIIGGVSSSFGSTGLDAFLTKKDLQGSEIWFNTFGGVNPEQVSDILYTTDGGFLILGSTESYGSELTDLLLVKVDVDGNEEWINTYGGSGFDNGNEVIISSTGAYYIIGSTGSYGEGGRDVWVLVVDDQGNEAQSLTLGDDLNNYGISIIEDLDGNFLLLSNDQTDNSDDYNVLLRKINSEGDLLWSNTYGGNQNDFAYSMVSDGFGGYMICGSTMSEGQGLKDGWVLKIDEDGSELLSHTYGGSSNDVFNEIIITNDNNFVLCGVTESEMSSGGYDVWLIKIDNQGFAIWERTIGGESSEQAYGIQEVIDGGFIITGSENSTGNNNYFLLKTDSEGIISD